VSFFNLALEQSFEIVGLNYIDIDIMTKYNLRLESFEAQEFLFMVFIYIYYYFKCKKISEQVN
jgi:hypothetical protein